MADGNGSTNWQDPSSPVIVDIGTAKIGDGVSLSSDVIAKLRDTTRNDVFVVFKVGNSFNAGYDSGTQFMLPRTINFIDTQGQSSDATKFSACIDANNNIYLDMDVDATGYFMSYYQRYGTTDYNDLSNRPIINQDLDEVGFTAVANTYYRHTGSTSTYTNGVVYFYDGTNFNAVGGASGGVPIVTITSQYAQLSQDDYDILHDNDFSCIKFNGTIYSKTFTNLSSQAMNFIAWSRNDSGLYFMNRFEVYANRYMSLSTSSGARPDLKDFYSGSASNGQVPTANGSGGITWKSLVGAWTSGTGGTLSLGTATGLYELKTTNTSGAWFLYRGDTTHVWTSNTVCYGSDIFHYVKVTTDGVLHWFKHDIGTSTEEEVVNPITYRKIGEV